MIVIALALATLGVPQQAPVVAPPVLPSAAAALDPARVAKAREVVLLMVPPDQREHMFETVVTSFMGNMISGMIDGDPKLREEFETIPEVKPVFARFVDRQRRLALGDLKSTMGELTEAYVSAYARAFTVDELEAMRAFFATPTGAHYIQVAPTLLSDPDFAAWQRHVGALAEARRASELKALLDDLAPILAAHADKPRGS